ncbi:MAG: hypothetical protein U0043_05435 [Streptococcus sp.]
MPNKYALSGRRQQTNFLPSSKNNCGPIFKKKSLPLFIRPLSRDDEEPISSEQLVELAQLLEEELAELNRDIEDTPVKGTNDRKIKRRKTKKVLRKVKDDFSVRAEKYETYQETFDGRNSFSKTDKQMRLLCE